MSDDCTVEKILGKRTSKKGKLEYKIKWSGCSEKVEKVEGESKNKKEMVVDDLAGSAGVKTPRRQHKTVASKDAAEKDKDKSDNKSETSSEKPEEKKNNEPLT